MYSQMSVTTNCAATVECVCDYDTEELATTQHLRCFIYRPWCRSQRDFRHANFCIEPNHNFLSLSLSLWWAAPSINMWFCLWDLWSHSSLWDCTGPWHVICWESSLFPGDATVDTLYFSQHSGVGWLMMAVNMAIASRHTLDFLYCCYWCLNTATVSHCLITVLLYWIVSHLISLLYAHYHSILNHFSPRDISIG